MADLIGIFNADSGKSVPKISDLKWFLVFEGLYNGQGSLPGNKLLEFKLKTVTSKLQPISLVFYLTEKRIAAVNQ